MNQSLLLPVPLILLIDMLFEYRVVSEPLICAGHADVSHAKLVVLHSDLLSMHLGIEHLENASHSFVKLFIFLLFLIV